MTQLPWTKDTGWVNSGNRPDKKTANGSRIEQSRRASSGGRAVLASPNILAALVQQAINGNGNGTVKAAVKQAPGPHCSFCKQKFASAKEQDDHFPWCEKNPNGIEHHNRVRSCRFCPATFDTVQDKNIHQSRCSARPGARPSKSTRVNCLWCFALITNREELYLHETRCMSRPLVGVPAPKPRMCNCCGAWFPSKNESGRHEHGCCKESAD